MEIFGVVYLIWNMVNGKKYVGQTIKTTEERFKEHCYVNSAIGNAIRKHGTKNFRYGIIKSCLSKAELDAWEQFFIVALRCKAPTGYNRTDGGEGTVGLKFTPEHCAKLSAAKSGSKNPNHGKHHSAQRRAKIGAVHKGKTLSTEHRAKLATAKLGNKNRLGKHNAPTTCSKISATTRGNSRFKNLLKELDSRKLSYRGFAEIMGLSRQSISNKMLEKQNFTASDKANLEKIFGKSIEYLLQLDEN